MKVGIIGAGFVGTSLGKALLKAHHEVMFSSRDPKGAKAQSLHAETGAPVGSIADVAAFSNVIVIAMMPDAVLHTAQENASRLSGKIVIDLNNRFGSSSGKSFAEDLAARLKGAKVVKAFNTIGAEHFQNPVFSGQHASMFIAGDDAEARKTVAQLASDIGFDPVDAGNLQAARLLEQLAEVWVHLTQTGNGRNIAFKLLKG